jgi:hypothetical protein
MHPFAKRLDPMKCKSRRSAPDDDIAMIEPYAARPVVPAQATEQEYR